VDKKNKYVVVNVNGAETAIIFPEWMAHSAFRHMGVISAGFFYVPDEFNGIECFGNSESLGGLESRPEEDTKLIKAMLYQ
jgi:hypothetical protein